MGKKNESGEKTMNQLNVNLVIGAPNFKVAEFNIRGNAPFVQNAFPEKARNEIRATQEAGSTGKKGKKREPKDFQAAYENAKHVSTDGWAGIPASAFRAAMVSACKTVGFMMTRAKQAIFIVADGFSRDGYPLVKITNGEPHYSEMYVRPEKGGVDLRPRPMWDPGWEATVRVRYDADLFTLQDCANLLMRAGIQVGVGEGRPDSKKSCGMGWGTFDILG